MSSLFPRDVTPGKTRLSLGVGVLDAIEAHALRGYPHEVVGLLAGDREAQVVSHAEVMENEKHGPAAARRFQVSALAIMKAEQRLEARGLEVVGYYHSHPDHPPNYSDTDLAMALPNMSYLIVEVSGGDDEPEVGESRSWRLSEDRKRMHFEPIIHLTES